MANRILVASAQLGDSCKEGSSQQCGMQLPVADSPWTGSSQLVRSDQDGKAPQRRQRQVEQRKYIPSRFPCHVCNLTEQLPTFSSSQRLQQSYGYLSTRNFQKPPRYCNGPLMPVQTHITVLLSCACRGGPMLTVTHTIGKPVAVPVLTQFKICDLCCLAQHKSENRGSA